MDCQQKSRLLLHDKNYPYYNIKEHRRLSLERRQGRGSSIHKKKDKKAKDEIAEDNKVKKISTLMTIWGNRPSRERKESVKDENMEKARGPNKFLKAAKMAAVISSVNSDVIYVPVPHWTLLVLFTTISVIKLHIA